MTNLTKDVHRFLEHDVAIKRDLQRGLLNKRALALYIEKHLHVSGVDAIISAIRRFENDLTLETHFSKAGALIRDAKISTKTGIAIIALVKDTAIQASLTKIFTMIHYDRGEVLRVIQAEESIKIIVDEKNVQKVTSLFKKSDVIKIEHDLAELNMNLDEKSAKIPGVLAILDTELASNSVNIVETISCVPELIWFIDQKDLLKAHNTFLKLIEGLSERNKNKS